MFCYAPHSITASRSSKNESSQSLQAWRPIKDNLGAKNLPGYLGSCTICSENFTAEEDCGQEVKA